MPEHVFHSGCIGCTQQEQHGVDFCYDCQYFDGQWDKPSLFKSAITPLVDGMRQEVKRRREEPSTASRTEARSILRDPARRRELLIELCREQVWTNTRTWVTYEEAAQVYDDLLAKQQLRKA
jgi:hypothetical protein